MCFSGVDFKFNFFSLKWVTVTVGSFVVVVYIVDRVFSFCSLSFFIVVVFIFV